MTSGALAYACPVQAEISPRFKRVLFTTDFSETSLKGLPIAGAVSRTFGSKLRLMYILTPGEEVCAVPEFAPGIKGSIVRDATARLDQLKYSPQLRGVNVDAEVYEGGFGSLGLKIAAEDFDLVVLATHGRGLRNLLLGSVAEDLIHSASCPVLTIGPQVNADAASEFRPTHVVFATDVSPDSFRALPHAIQFAEGQCADLTLVHVLPKAQKGSPDAEGFAALMRDGLHRMLPLTAIKNCNPEIVVSFGNPVVEILKVAQERGSDLIVMGARSRTKKPTFSRSVSYGVISQATCPVLTVRGTC